MEKALKFEKSCGRMTHTFRRGFLKKPLRAFSGCSAAGSAPALGAGCRRFESCHSDQKRGVPSGGAPHFSSKGNREPAASLFKLPPGCAGACAAWPQVRILSLGPYHDPNLLQLRSWFFCTPTLSVNPLNQGAFWLLAN